MKSSFGNPSNYNLVPIKISYYDTCVFINGCTHPVQDIGDWITIFKQITNNIKCKVLKASVSLVLNKFLFVKNVKI